MPLDDELDELFVLPPDKFTAARDDLAKRLKESGDKATASEVKALWKPTIVAWALNQLARGSRRDLEVLIEAGELLRAAQRKALSGVKGGDFREAMAARRLLITDLTHQTMEILGRAGGGSQGAEEEIGRSLEAVSSDPEAADLHLRGRLQRPITSVSGFDAVSGLGIIDGGGSEESVDRDQDRTAERKATETTIRNAERQVEKAEADARRSRMRADNLQQQIEELSDKAADAVGQAERLEKDAQDALRHLDDLKGK